MEVNQEVSGMIDDLVRESLGSLLRSEREKKGLTVREVAEALRLMPYQIEALEKESFADFKAAVFVRSYIRNYAKLLGLDESPLLSLYEQHHQVEQAMPVIKRPLPIQMPCKKRYVGVVAAVVILLLLWLLNQDDGAEKNSSANDLSQDIISEASIVSPATDDAITNIKQGQKDSTLLDSSPADDSSSSTLQTTASNPGQNIDATMTETLSAGSGHRLSMRFSSECWVEVKDAEGNVLVSDLKKDGDSLELDGVAPFEVLLGYAPAVTLLYNGDVVDINVNTRSKAAKLTVGRS